MIDDQYFLRGLTSQVDQLDGAAIVELVLHRGGHFYVRDVVDSHEGYVQLNVWHGPGGQPIEAPSSAAYSDEMPAGHHPIAMAYESIAFVNVIPTSEPDRQRIGFHRPQ